ncbi:MAG: alpha/beta hydrolase [Comamonadaceae bacterium]|nr:MAG: alpha/beta hydrolase [Comamonadaceae bacterium]
MARLHHARGLQPCALAAHRHRSHAPPCARDGALVCRGGAVTAPTTWVLLRGLTREARHWGAFPDLLRGHLRAGTRVVALDLPGNGALNAMASPSSIEATAQACRARLQALGVPPPYAVVAMSLGAMVAVEWALQHPAELRCAVLVNTSLRPFSPWYQRLRPRSYGALLRVALTAQPARLQEAAVLALTTRHPPQPAAVLDRWTALRESRPVTRANALRQLAAAMRYRAPQRAPLVPMLAVASAADSLVDPRCTRRLAALWALPLREHPSAGHDLPLDDGPWLAAVVGRWAAQRLGDC